MTETSVLGPIDPASIPQAEAEKSAPWIVRKLVGSMTGRIVMSSWETLKASGTGVVCLSPWGDSVPLLLPCIRFRDLAVHTIIVATGGVGAIAAPVMGPVSDAVVSSLGDTILVEIGLHTGFELTTKAANDLVIEHTIKHAIPVHSSRLETTAIKTLTITLKYKHTMEDAALGFYRSSIHKDSSLFSTVMDYLAIEKGWFSPYLFASGRRPIIPRAIKPDVIFCHGPFLSGDYAIGQTLLTESASVITFCPTSTNPAPEKEDECHLTSGITSLTNMFTRSRTPSPAPALTPLPVPPTPRRMVILVVGLKPHRKLWSTSARPEESVIQYQLLNGCPAIVIPVKVGAPLVAWDGLTLESVWNVRLPKDDDDDTAEEFHGMVRVLFEFVDLCVDWDRVVFTTNEGTESIDLEEKRNAVKTAVGVLVASAVRSGSSKEVRKEVDKERSGIAMWRIP